MKLKRMLALLAAVCLLCALCACRDMDREEESTNQNTTAAQSTSGKTHESEKDHPSLPNGENEGKTEVGAVGGKDDIFGDDGLELPDDPLDGTIPDPEPVSPTVVVESTQPTEESKGQSADGDLELPPDDFEQP